MPYIQRDGWYSLGQKSGRIVEISLLLPCVVVCTLTERKMSLLLALFLLRVINNRMQISSLIILLLWAQGAYFAITGLWPLFHYPSFEKVTGPKADVWLVKTVGALVSVIALLLLIAAVYREINVSTVIAGAGTAFALMMVDIIYVSKKVIRPIYLADAIIEMVLVSIWILYLYKML